MPIYHNRKKFFLARGERDVKPEQVSRHRTPEFLIGEYWCRAIENKSTGVEMGVHGHDTHQGWRGGWWV